MQSSTKAEPESPPPAPAQDALPEGRRLPASGTVLLRGLVRHVGRGYQRVTLEMQVEDLLPVLFEGAELREGVEVHAPETLAMALAADEQALQRRLRGQGL
jgi:hypothetical protein